MNQVSFWKKDWLVGLSVTVLFFLATNSDLMQSLERKAYDLGVLATSRVPSDKIAIIAMDDQSIANIGRLPWPREVHAKMIDILAAGNAKVVGHTVLFSEPQVDAGLGYINKIAAVLGDSTLKNTNNPAQRSGCRFLNWLRVLNARVMINGPATIRMARMIPSGYKSFGHSRDQSSVDVKLDAKAWILFAFPESGI